MLMTGEEYLESIRDGRRVYVGGELVEDVTTHPAFRNAAQSFAMIYDRKRAPENRDVMTFEEDGETFSSYFLLPRTREDLAAPVRDPPAHRVVDARPDRPVARQLPELRQRAGHGPGDVRPHPAGLRRQHPQLLPPHARERHLRVPHRDQSAGLARCEPGRARRSARRRRCAWSTRTTAASPSTA